MVDVLYEPLPPERRFGGTRYYPQTEAARLFFQRFLADASGGYGFAGDDHPDLGWLEEAGLTHASKEPE